MTMPLSNAGGTPVLAGYQTGYDSRSRAIYTMYVLNAVVAPKSTDTVKAGEPSAGWVDLDYVQIHAMDQVKRQWGQFKWWPFPLVDPVAWMNGRASVAGVVPGNDFGPSYGVIGSPQVWASPFTGQVFGTVIQAKNESVGDPV